MPLGNLWVGGPVRSDAVKRLNVTPYHTQVRNSGKGPGPEFTSNGVVEWDRRGTPPDERAEMLSARVTGAGEVDEAALRVGMDQFHPNLVADIEAGSALLDASFDGRIEDANPCPFA